MSDLGNKEVMAKNLAFYVARSGKTQKELAEIVGVAATTFNDWIRGKKYPRIDKIEILANYFGILKSDLIEDKSALEKENKPTTLTDSELTNRKRVLMQLVRDCPEEQAEYLLQIIQLILDGKNKGI